MPEAAPTATPNAPATAAAPLLVPVQKRIIVFKDGLPELTTQPVLNYELVRNLYWIVAAQPFVVDDPLDPEFAKYDGMTIAEVMVRKQLEAAARSGDDAKIETAMNRLIGKALAKSESVSVSFNGNYEAWLEEKAKALKQNATVDAEVVPNEPVPFGDLA